MTVENESSEPKNSNLDGAVLEYWDSIQKAIETESGKLKERVERDSSEILARAEEEAKTTITKARQDAGVESERIISEAKEEAKKIVDQARQEAELESEQIIARSREEAEKAAKEYREKVYTEVLQESARVIDNTREKLSRTITEIIEHNITQAKDDFSRVASEARTELEAETSQILTQAGKSVKEIFGETDTETEIEFESPLPLTTESEAQEKPYIETNDKGDESSQQTSGEGFTPMASVCKEADLGTHSIGGKLNTKTENIDDNRLFEGRLKVEIVCSPYKEQNWDMQGDLARVPGIKVISTDNYNRGNSQIMANVIELEKPMPLFKSIKNTMHVKAIAERRGYIVITTN